MKVFCVFFFGIFSAVAAQAVVKAPGTFLPRECSVSRHVGSMPLVGIREVCVGRVVVSRAQATRAAVQFRLTTGPEEMFVVAQKKSLGVVPQDPRLMRVLLDLRARDGRRSTVRMLQTDEGRTHSLSGRVGVVQFDAREFETVFARNQVLDGVPSRRPSRDSARAERPLGW